jgi:hypothetical protein
MTSIGPGEATKQQTTSVESPSRESFSPLVFHTLQDDGDDEKHSNKQLLFEAEKMQSFCSNLIRYHPLFPSIVHIGMHILSRLLALIFMVFIISCLYFMKLSFMLNIYAAAMVVTIMTFLFITGVSFSDKTILFALFRTFDFWYMFSHLCIMAYGASLSINYSVYYKIQWICTVGLSSLFAIFMDSLVLTRRVNFIIVLFYRTVGPILACSLFIVFDHFHEEFTEYPMESILSSGRQIYYFGMSSLYSFYFRNAFLKIHGFITGKNIFAMLTIPIKADLGFAKSIKSTMRIILFTIPCIVHTILKHLLTQWTIYSQMKLFSMTR